MLDRTQLAQKITLFAPDFFIDTSAQAVIAFDIWRRLISDDIFLQAVQQASTPWTLPIWSGKLDQIYTVQKSTKPYSVMAVDGSQVFPDRHQGLSCYLINVGIIQFWYGETSSVRMEAIPFIFSGYDQEGNEVTVDQVSSERTAYEFEYAYLKMREYAQQNVNPDVVHPDAVYSDAVYSDAVHSDVAPSGTSPIILFDGSLIFWHLDQRDEKMRDQYHGRYLMPLQQFYEQGIIYGSYISLSHSKELVHIIRAGMQLLGITDSIDQLVDADIVDFFLTPGNRTTVFAHCSEITQLYPAHLKPYFFYLHVGTEIARVEIPAFVAQSQEKVDTLAACIMDQVAKGGGYPVCLAEAHEQAVIKAPDREFFYSLLFDHAQNYKKKCSFSQKLLRKKSIRI